MALGLPYTFTYVYLYSLQIQRKPTKEKKKLVKRFSALRMCATKTYGLISSYLSEKWVLYHWASMFIPRTIYYIIWCFPNSHCNCACKKKQRFAFAVQLNAVSTHRHTQIRYQSTNPPWWKDAIWHNIFGISSGWTEYFQLLLCHCETFQQVMTSFPLRNYYHQVEQSIDAKSRWKWSAQHHQFVLK